MDEKIYFPETIPENPFPGDEPVEIGAGNTSVAGGSYKPATTKDQQVPTKRIATELLSSALNTKSKKITKEFQFTESGALQVGKYENGVSGDVRISPAGITARNTSGNPTFSLDGETGDATFAGTVQAGAVIAANIDGDLITAGSVTADKLSVSQLDAVATNTGTLTVDETITVGGSVNGKISLKNSSGVEKILLDNTGITINEGKVTIKNSSSETVMDATGLKSTTSFITGQVGSYDTSTDDTTTGTYADIPDMTLSSFNLTRTTGVLVLVSAVCETFSGGGGGELVIYVGGEINDVQQVRIKVPPDQPKSTYTTYLLRQLPVTGTPPVSYTIKMQWITFASTRLELQQRQISYMLFGT